MIKDADRIKKEYNDLKKEYSKSKTETNKTRLAAKEEQLRRVANAIRQARADEVDAKNESSVVDDQGMQRVGTSLPQTKEDDVELTESAEPKIITQLRDVMKSGYKKLKDPKSGKTMTVDSYSASAIVNVYDALKDPKNKEKFSSMGLLGMQSTAFKLIK
jgi:dsDNA-specific endonuclease/ATPase MutS2